MNKVANKHEVINNSIDKAKRIILYSSLFMCICLLSCKNSNN